MTGRLAVVTGASGGIGVEIARKLSADGYYVVGQFRTGRERATQLETALAASRWGGEVVEADLSTSAGVATLVSAVRSRSSQSGLQVTALINNAARMLGPSFVDATPEEFDDFVAINTKAPFFLAQHLSRDMVAGSSIVNISSASAHIASAGDIVYAMTKSALESLTRNMAEALAPAGLRVNAVMPGFTNNGHIAFSDDTAVAYMGSLSMLGGVAAPSAIADAVSFLVSERASRTTGTVLDVSGGMSLHPRPHRHGSVRDFL